MRGRNGPGSVSATSATIASTSPSSSARIVTTAPDAASTAGRSGTARPASASTIWWPSPPNARTQPAGGLMGVPRNTTTVPSTGRQGGQVAPRLLAVVGRGVEHRHVGPVAPSLPRPLGEPGVRADEAVPPGVVEDVLLHRAILPPDRF